MKTVNRVTLIIAILFICSSNIFSQNVKPESVVDVSSKSTFNKIPEGTEVTIIVILSIKDSWHINANKPLGGSLTPTEIKIDRSKDYAVQSIKYPAAEMITLPFSSEELALYESRATVKIKMIVSKNFEGKELKVEGKLQYQPCNNQTCLFPVSKPFIVEVKLKD
jgi:hypothetical protein